MLLINEICNFFNCEIKDLDQILFNPTNRAKLLTKFYGVWLKTTYKTEQDVFTTFNLMEFHFKMLDTPKLIITF